MLSMGEVFYLFCTMVCCKIFEWWYYRKYGTSFIEQVSLNHLGPLLGPPDYNGNGAGGEANGNGAGGGTAPQAAQATQGKIRSDKRGRA